MEMKSAVEMVSSGPSRPIGATMIFSDNDGMSASPAVNNFAMSRGTYNHTST